MARGGKRENAGRKKGATNNVSAKYRDLIIESNPIEFLISAFKKGFIADSDNIPQFLTYKERCDIARDLVKKIIPDLKTIDHAGDISFDGNLESSITVKFITVDANQVD